MAQLLALGSAVVASAAVAWRTARSLRASAAALDEARGAVGELDAATGRVRTATDRLVERRATLANGERL